MTDTTTPTDPDASSNPQSKYLLHSRLVVKHLPAHTTSERLRRLFSSYGDITDLKLMRTKEGAPRGFAFVGYRTNKSAKKALRALHDTYIDLNKIAVEFAKAYQADDIQRPWSKHSKGSSRAEARERQEEQGRLRKRRRQEGSGVAEDATEADEGRRKRKRSTEGGMGEGLREYLGLSGVEGRAGSAGRRRGKAEGHQFWANDSEVPQETDAAEGEGQRGNGSAHAAVDSGDDGEGGGPEGEEGHGSGRKRGKKRQRGDDAPLDAGEGSQNVVRNQKVFSDMDYLKSRMTAHIDDDAGDGGSSDDNDNSGTLPKNSPGGEHVDVMDTGRIVILNLPFLATEEDIIELCKKFGELTEVHIPINSESKQSKGIAFVTFLIPEHAKKAMQSLHTTIFMGRMIHAVAAKPQPAKDNRRQKMDTTSYKKKLEMKQRLQAQSSHNWNTLYLNKDAVLEQTSRALQVSKSDLLLDGSSNTAVRMAIGETELLKSTKEILEEAGIDLSSINIVDRTATSKSVIINNPNRSKTCILVKNLPPDTTEHEMEELFSGCGDLKNVMLINQVLALIEFVEPSHARKAFRSLAYTKFKHVPLYLEWAPIKSGHQEDSNSNSNNNKQTKKKKQETNVVEKNGVRMLKEQVDSKKVVAEGKESATLFIKNLNFNTKEELLRSFLVKCLQSELETQQDAAQFIRKVTIAQRKGKSAGFAFVEFSSLKFAKLALDKCQGRALDDHALHLQYANIEKKEDDTTRDDTIEDDGENFFMDKEGRSVTFKKLAVKNVAFEVTRQDLYQLFGTYGVVKEIRLPQKVAGGHRGFAFVEFASAKECHAAYDALKTTHLYGRRLVLEFAADEAEENVQLQQSRLQKRMTQGYGKKRKRKQAE